MGVLSNIAGLYRKYWTVPTALLSLEAVLASYSIHKAVRQDRPVVEVFLDYHNQFLSNIDSLISVPLALYSERAHLRSFRENNDSISFEELVTSVNHPKTLNALEDLIVRDKADVSTEIPFQIWLQYDDDKKPFLIFYEKPGTLNGRNAKLLAKYRDNPNFVLDFVKSNEKHYKLVTNIPEDLYKKHIKLLEGINKLEKSQVVSKELESLRNRLVGRDLGIIKKNLASSMADLYIWNADDWSIEDNKSIKDFYLSNFLKFKGTYVGEGHIHLLSIDGPEPSPKDLDASEYLRQIIFAETHRVMRVYDISKGQIKSTDFKIK